MLTFILLESNTWLMFDRLKEHIWLYTVKT